MSSNYFYEDEEGRLRRVGTNKLVSSRSISILNTPMWEEYRRWQEKQTKINPQTLEGITKDQKRIMTQLPYVIKSILNDHPEEYDITYKNITRYNSFLAVWIEFKRKEAKNPFLDGYIHVWIGNDGGIKRLEHKELIQSKPTSYSNPYRWFYIHYKEGIRHDS